MSKTNELSFYSLVDLFTKKIQSGALKLDLNGHFSSALNENGIPYYFEQNFSMDLHSSYSSFFKDGMELLEAKINGKDTSEEESKKEILTEKLNALLEGKKVAEFPLVKLESYKTCPNCKEPLILWTDGERIFIKEKCKVEFKPFEVMIPVPSGKLVIENNLREYFSVFENRDINNFSGTKETTEDYAKEFMFHSYVGNSCPAYKYLNKKNQSGLIIGQLNKEQDEAPYDYIEDPDSLGSVCTDLWWFSIVDYDILKKRCELMGEEFNPEHFEIIDIKKGWYKSTSFFPVTHYDNDTFATMEYVKEVEDDFLEKVVIAKSPLKNESSNSISDYSYFKILEKEEYASLRPSLSVLLWDKYIDLETEEEKDNWFPYNYADYKLEEKTEDGKDMHLGYMDVVLNKIETYLDIFEDQDFYDQIPVFDEEYFMLSKPNSHFKYHSLGWYPRETTFPWKAAYYPYEVDVQELVFILIFYKSLFEYKAHEAMKEHFEGKDANPELVLDKMIFTLNLAYTNIVERDIKEEFLVKLKEIKRPENWNKIKGYSDGLIKSLTSEFEFETLKYEYIFGFENESEKEKLVSDKMKKALNWYFEEDPKKKMNRLMAKIKEKNKN